MKHATLQKIMKSTECINRTLLFAGHESLTELW